MLRRCNTEIVRMRVIQMLRNATGEVGVQFRLFQCYEGVWTNIISVTRGWGCPIAIKSVT